MAFFIALKQIVEEESDTIHQALKAEFDKLFLGTLSLPIKLPGTNYLRGFEV
jgi:brassinosteroid-6-oxidase 1